MPRTIRLKGALCELFLHVNLLLNREKCRLILFNDFMLGIKALVDRGGASLLFEDLNLLKKLLGQLLSL